MAQATVQKASWVSGYKAFLLDKNESLFLKVAPLVLLFGSPEVIVANLIPVVGEALDLGTFSITVLVAFRTYRAVQRHR